MEQKNILVIAPYNLQVNYLKTVLPAGARVGTVDKFQGQEAEAVLISMTTSSRDELPHDFEFLYSKNRLNVAISRARIFSCVIASPRLLEVSCSTVEQMKLANTLCWARQYAASA
jgi:superfamily I DNA and/or RNA helicase